LHCPACLVGFPNEVASVSSLAASARISWTLSSSPNPRPKLNAPIQCLPQPRLQVLGLWYDNPADIVISVCWRPTGTPFAVHRCAAIFEAIEPFLYAWDANGIVPESLLDVVNGFHLGIAKLLAEFDAILLLKSFRHFATINNPTSGHYSSSLIGRLSPTDAFCGPEKIRSCTWMSATQLHLRTHRSLHLFTREKLRFYTFWTANWKAAKLEATSNFKLTNYTRLEEWIILRFVDQETSKSSESSFSRKTLHATSDQYISRCNRFELFK
jgi:hypothetical protein